MVFNISNEKLCLGNLVDLIKSMLKLTDGKQPERRRLKLFLIKMILLSKNLLLLCSSLLLGELINSLMNLT